MPRPCEQELPWMFAQESAYSRSAVVTLRPVHRTCPAEQDYCVRPHKARVSRRKTRCFQHGLAAAKFGKSGSVGKAERSSPVQIALALT
jgi:hypothetical protein